MRLLVAEHPYVDGNKHTALTTAVVCYALNDDYLDHDDRIRTLLKEFAKDERQVELELVRLREWATPRLGRRRADPVLHETDR